MAGRRLLIAIALLCAPAIGHAQIGIVSTPLFSTAEKRIGHEHRADLQAAIDDIKAGEITSAEARLGAIRGYCDAQRRPNRRIVSVADAAEYDEYMAAQHGNEPVEWIDIVCPSAYAMTGYLAAGQGQAEDALRWLDAASALAPYFADPRNERGFVLGQLRRFDDALAAYREAIAVADSHPRAAYIKPLSLRGIGFVLTEMGDLDGAQRAYEASLQLDPHSDVAKNELEYIARKRREPIAAPPSDSTSKSMAPETPSH